MRRFLLLSAGFGLFGALPAWADDKPAPTTGPELDRKMAQTDVGERRQAQYSADGIRLGGFIAYPKAELDEQFSDNIYASGNNRKGDLLNQISPSLRVQSDLPRHELKLSVNGDFLRYTRYTKENVDNYNAAATGKLDVLRDGWLNGQASYDVSHEPRSAPDRTTGIEPNKVTTRLAGLGGEYRPGRIWLKADTSFQRLEFDDVADGTGALVVNHLRNRDMIQGGLRAAYEIIPDYFAFLETRANQRRYDSLNAQGLRRNSSGYEQRVGTDIELSGKLRGDVFASWMNQHYDDPRFSGIAGPGFGAGLTWNVTALTTARLQAQRTIEETVSTNVSGFVQSRGTASVEHELRRNVIISADGGVELDDFHGSSLSETVYDGGVRAQYKLNKFAYTGLTYHYFQRFASDDSLDYHENRVLVTLGVQY